MKYDGVIFDVDGTIWNATQAIADSWNECLTGKFGPDCKMITAAEVQSVMGLVMQAICDKLFIYYGVENPRELSDECMRYEAGYIAEHGGILYDGIEETFAALSKECKVCIVSNCDVGYIEGLIKVTGFGKYVIDFESAGGTGLNKAQNIRLVCERNGIEHPIYVGDTELDMTSAEESGCKFVYASYGFGDISREQLTISKPTDLIELYHQISE